MRSLEPNTSKSEDAQASKTTHLTRYEEERSQHQEKQQYYPKLAQAHSRGKGIMRHHFSVLFSLVK